MDIYNCLYCKKELNKARNTKKYCDDKCRKYYNRSISGTIKRDIAGQDNLSGTVSVTESLEQAKVSVTLAGQDETLKQEKIRIAKEAIERAMSKSTPMWEEPTVVEVGDDGELKYCEE